MWVVLILAVIGIATYVWFTMLFVGACKALTQISIDMTATRKHLAKLANQTERSL